MLGPSLAVLRAQVTLRTTSSFSLAKYKAPPLPVAVLSSNEQLYTWTFFTPAGTYTAAPSPFTSFPMKVQLIIYNVSAVESSGIFNAPPLPLFSLFPKNCVSLTMIAGKSFAKYIVAPCWASFPSKVESFVSKVSSDPQYIAPPIFEALLLMNEELVTSIFSPDGI